MGTRRPRRGSRADRDEGVPAPRYTVFRDIIVTVNFSGYRASKKVAPATTGRGVAGMRITPGPEVPMLPKAGFLDALFAVTM